MALGRKDKQTFKGMLTASPLVAITGRGGCAGSGCVVGGGCNGECGQVSSSKIEGGSGVRNRPVK